MIQEFLNNPAMQIEFLGNTLNSWTIAGLVFLVAIIVLKFFQLFIVSRLKTLSKKTKTELDDIAINAIHAIHWPFYVLISIFIALKSLNIPEVISQWSYNIVIIVVIYYAIKAIQEFIDYGTEKIMSKRGEKADSGMIKILSGIAKFALWIIAFLMILSNLGYNITSLIAGLGIGGIAIALALQNILSDLFSSISIYLDKPFKVGDFIIIGEHMGVVKKIGIKSTRIQTLQGEELVVSNNELTSARIQNFGRMQRRRIVFSVGVAYDTPYKILEKIPTMIKEALGKHKKAELDRAHLKSFGDSSLNYETVYYVNAPDYSTYMDIQQAVNLEILEKFEKEKIEIAFPTRTVYLKK